MPIVDCRALWPHPPHALNHWAHVAGELGASVQLPRPFLICLRGVRPLANETHELSHTPEYDDTGVLLALGDSPIIFPMASHAFQSRSRLSPDPNRDGLGDVGSIRPGRYVLHDQNDSECTFWVKTPAGSDRLPCWRDFNGDRFLSPEEIAQSEALRSGAQVGDDGTWADSILLHGGLDSPPEAKHRYSIGCLTASLRYRDMLRRRAKLRGGQIDLVLANATDVLPFAEDAQALYGAPELRDPADEPTRPINPRRV